MSAEWGGEDVDALADWLGEQEGAFNVTDLSDEQTTWLTVSVDDFARALLASRVVVPARVAEQAERERDAARDSLNAYLDDPPQPLGAEQIADAQSLQQAALEGERAAVREVERLREELAEANEDAEAAEAETARLRGAIEALAELGVREQWPPDEWRAGLRAALAEPVGEGGRS